MSFLKRARAPSTSPIGSRFSPFPAVAGDPVRHQKLLKKTHKEAQTKVRFPSRKVTGPRPRRNRIAESRCLPQRLPEAAPPMPEIGFDSQNRCPSRWRLTDDPSANFR